MQERIDRPGAQVVAVPPELPDDREAEDLALRGVVKDVEANEASPEVLALHARSDLPPHAARRRPPADGMLGDMEVA